MKSLKILILPLCAKELRTAKQWNFFLALIFAACPIVNSFGTTVLCSLIHLFTLIK